MEGAAKDKDAWMIRPRVRAAAGHVAGFAAYGCIAIIVLNVLVPLSIYTGHPDAAMAAWITTNDVFFLWTILLALLAPWCHTVLVAERGFYLTRAVCELMVFPAAFLLIGTIYTHITGELMLSYQMGLPFFMALAWLFGFLFNLGNMAAAPRNLRITVPVALFLLVLCGTMVGLLELMVPCAVLQTAACALLYRPLYQLQSIAPRIIALPPLPDTPGA